MAFSRVKPDTDEVERLQNKILEVLTEGSGPNTVEGLEALTLFCMGASCPDCRRSIATELKRRIPARLAHACTFAAENPERVHTH